MPIIYFKSIFNDFKSHLYDLNFFLFLTVENDDWCILLGHSPSAVIFYTQIVPVHCDPEEAWLSPVSPPTVPSNPILDSVLHSPADNCDFVVNSWDQFGLRENTSSVGFEFKVSVNTAWNGSSSVDLGFHFVSTFDTSILSNFPDWIFRLSPTVSFVSGFDSCWSSAVLAFLNIWAFKVVRVFSNVGLASFFWNTVSVGINIDLSRVSSIAGSAGFAVDDDLWR